MRAPIRHLPRVAALIAAVLLCPGLAGADGETAGDSIPEALGDALVRFVRDGSPRAPSHVEIPALGDFDVPGLAAEDVEIRLSGSADTRSTGVVPVTAVLLARSDGTELKRGVVTARVRSPVPVVVAARALSRGAVIHEADLVQEERDLATLPRDYLGDPGLAVGRHAARALPAGTLLRERLVELRPVVSRGQLVQLRYQQGALRIDGRGKAREDGRAGDVIRVQNVASNREVSGWVDADGVVHVDF